MLILAARDVPVHDDGMLPFWPEGQSMPLVWIIGLATVLVAAILCWRAIVLTRRWQTRSEPMRQFVQVARQVGLSWPEMLALRQIARVEQLTTPLTLLVCASTLSHHSEAAATKLPPRQAKALRRTAAQVLDRLG